MHNRESGCKTVAGSVFYLHCLCFKAPLSILTLRKGWWFNDYFVHDLKKKIDEVF